MVKRNNIISIIVSALLAFVLLFTGIIPTVAYADDSSSVTEIEYSNVLDDLHKDSSFDETAYPAKADDYTLSVITVAESENGELFLYVYQPSYGAKTLVASSVNISIGRFEYTKYINYDLSLLSQDGVFQKYRVEGLVVGGEETRCYLITSLFRLWDSTIDDELDKTTENRIDEVAYSVAKQFIFKNTVDGFSLSVDDIDVITVTDKYCGFVRFLSHNYDVFGDDYDAHFVAFNTDKTIEKLYYADITYISRSAHDYWNSQSGDVTLDTITYGEEKKENITIDSSQNVVIDTGGLFQGNTYFFKRIQTVKDFSDELEKYANDDDLVVRYNPDKLSGTEWVLRFVETDYIDDSLVLPVVVRDITYTEISQVSIMRLYFETDGVTYNLGVIDNKTTGSKDPFATVGPDDESWFEKIYSILFLVVFLLLYKTFLAPFVNPIISMVIKLAFKGIGIAIKWAFAVITLPLRLLFRRRK